MLPEQALHESVRQGSLRDVVGQHAADCETSGLAPAAARCIVSCP